MVRVSSEPCTICGREDDVFVFTLLGLEVPYCVSDYCGVVDVLSPGSFSGVESVDPEDVWRRVRRDVGDEQ